MHVWMRDGTQLLPRNTFAHAYIHAYICTCIHAHIHTSTHTHTHMFTHTHIHTHIRIHIHIHLKRTPCSSITVSARCAFKRDLFASKETYKRDVCNAISNETCIHVKTPTKETHIRVKRPTKKTDHMTSNLQDGQAISQTNTLGTGIVERIRKGNSNQQISR